MMGTATILGTEYPIVRMPDGKEWLAENVVYAPLQQSSDAVGSLFSQSGANSLHELLTSTGWRVPTDAEWSAMGAALPGATWSASGGYLSSGGNVPYDARFTGGVGALLKDPTGWLTPYNVSPYVSANEFGFSAKMQGDLTQRIAIWRCYVPSPGSGAPVWFVADNSTSFPKKEDWSTTSGLHVRLVRDYTPILHGFTGMDLGVAPEWGYEPKITPSLTWTKTASGLWRCLDDGAAFDAYDAEITVKVSGAIHSAWETFIATNRGAEVTYYAPAGVRPFGPHIDCTTGVQVVIGDAWATDWRVGITADCYTLHIPMRYVGGYTPTTATIPAVVARKYPTPTWFYPTKVHATEAGTATAVPRDTETQTTQIIIDNLALTAGAEMVNWCLYQRGTSFTYTPTAGACPFGVAAGDGPFTVRLIGWSCQKPKPNRWDMTLDLAREA